jgi:hypothetical protein
MTLIPSLDYAEGVRLNQLGSSQKGRNPMNNKEDNPTKEEIVMSDEKQEPKRSGVSGLVFVGCLILGLAVGLLLGNIAVGLLGGLGVGFIAMAIARYITGEW